MVAALDEEDRIAATVRALRGLALVGRVVVADDGSDDGTARVARDSGAYVIRSRANRGKGRAIEAAVSRVRADVYLLADGDVGRSAASLGPVLDEVVSGRADLAVALPPRPPTGGFGLVKRAARRLIATIGGREPQAPLSGQRALTRECLQACRPLAPGFGLEAAMLADALRMGFAVSEIPTQVEHRFTRRDLAGFTHRGRQGLDMLRALVPRLAGVR